MISWWSIMSKGGIRPGMQEQQQRAVLLSNRLAAILFLLNIVAAIAVFFVYHWQTMVALVLINNMGYGAVLLLNQLGYSNSSRVLLCLYLPLSTIGISLFAKTYGLHTEEVSFATSKVVMLVAASLPIIMFELRERWYLVGTLLLNAFCMFFYDAVHNFFGVGYYQMGYHAAAYLFFNLITFSLYALLVSGFLYYKRVLEKAEYQLKKSHGQLQEFNTELSLQHTEIQAQAKTLLESQLQLQQATTLIEQQKELLKAENMLLHQHLLEKNLILEASNRELHKRLDELQQFSYTISHNLRGPVANLLGLVSLFKREEAHPKNQQIMQYTHSAAAALDGVIKDLSQVLHLRDEHKNTEAIQLDYLLENVLLCIRKEETPGNLQIEKQLEVFELQGIKAYVHSILYNLISNAGKYRHPARKCQIFIRSLAARGGVLLEVSDNGIGIDLEKYGKDIFKMYKRFNESHDGRGLGLYLVKTQAEIMGGFVEVQSKPDKGSSFFVWLPCVQAISPSYTNKHIRHKSKV